MALVGPHLLHLDLYTFWEVLSFLAPLEVLDAPSVVCKKWRASIAAWARAAGRVPVFFRAGVDGAAAEAYWRRGRVDPAVPAGLESAACREYADGGLVRAVRHADGAAWSRVIGEDDVMSSVECIALSTPEERRIGGGGSAGTYLFAGTREGHCTEAYCVDAAAGGAGNALRRAGNFANSGAVWSTCYWREHKLLLSGTAGACVDVHYVGDLREASDASTLSRVPASQQLHHDDSVFVTQVVDAERGVFAAGGWDGGVTLYELNRGAAAPSPGEPAKLFRHIARKEGVHGDALWRAGLVTGAGGAACLVSGGWDGTAALLDLDALQVVATWNDAGGPAVADLRVIDRALFWTLDQANDAVLHDVRTRAPAATVPLSGTPHTNRINGTPLFLLTASDRLVVYDMRRLRADAGIALPDPLPFPSAAAAPPPPRHHREAIVSIEFPSPHIAPLQYQHDFLAYGRFSGELALCRSVPAGAG
eukprot:TRINITY_DN13148_c0_g1_i1.p1 TRINITY_DN13148_c0_g1~~TRINITY_DN13148_c0_g1_i1.p1  ORF type:complete len:477 (+),score=134.05 TRINITY_DN13148_c0_g1_i1:114-1544(+)